MGFLGNLFGKKESPAQVGKYESMENQMQDNDNICDGYQESNERGNDGTSLAEQIILGTWTSYSVVDNSGNDISDIFEPDGLKLTLNPNHNAKLNIDGEEYTPNNWSFDNNCGYFERAFDEIDGTEFNLSFVIEGDKLIAKYNGEGLYKEYTCSK